MNHTVSAANSSQVNPAKRILALSGGVGGAKLVQGFAEVLPPAQLEIVANTGDDFEHLGLPISPDLDTVMYTLAGLNNPELGWGQVDESWSFMQALEKLGGESWFALGDRDLATHVRRRQLLAQGLTLEQATATLCQQLGVAQRLVPMSNQSVSTQVCCDGQWLDFQHYFVREQCQPQVSAFRFAGIEQALPSERFAQLLDGIDDLGAIVVCPSNPFVSIDPILQLPGVLPKLKRAAVPVIAVSPIVAGQAIKGPTAKMMLALDMPVSASAVADYYRDWIDGFVLDSRDQASADELERSGIAVCTTNTIMQSLEDKRQLARAVLQFIPRLAAA